MSTEDTGARPAPLDRLERLLAAYQEQTQRACRFNADAESHCDCPAHRAYRKHVTEAAPPAGGPQAATTEAPTPAPTVEWYTKRCAWYAAELDRRQTASASVRALMTQAIDAMASSGPVMLRWGGEWRLATTIAEILREATEDGELVVSKDDHGDSVCQHGTAMDVHCCNCHRGFIFDADHVCVSVEREPARVKDADLLRRLDRLLEAPRRWFQHSPHCCADEYYSQGCDCGLYAHLVTIREARAELERLYGITR